ESPLRVVAEVTLNQPAREPAKESKQGVFAWLGTNKEALTVLALLVGGLWTVYQYMQSEKEKTRLQREAAIVQFYGDLANKEKRNTAAYGLATLARDEALPILTATFKERALSDSDPSKPDPSFKRALDDSLILIGSPALEAIKKLNRDAGRRLT